MALYRFRALKDQNGEVAFGTFEAESEAVAMSELRKSYVRILSLGEVREVAKKKGKLRLFRRRRATISQKAMFFRKLYILTSAGLTNAEALEVLLDGEENEELCQILQKLLAGVRKGHSISSVSKEHQFFGANILALLQVGNETGHLEESLEHIADYLDEVAESRKNLSSALAYPLFLIFSFFLVFFVIIFYCVPSFERAFEPIIRSGSLPLVTRVIFGVSDFICNYYLVFILCLAIPFLIVCYKFRGKWRDKLYRLPLFRKTFTGEAMRNLSLLIGANISASNATALVAGECGVGKLKQIFRDATESLDRGEAIDVALGKHLSRLDSSLLSVGLTGARLAEVCLLISEQYKREAEILQKKVLSLLEPSLVLLIGLMVALLAFGIYLPCIKMIEGFSM